MGDAKRRKKLDSNFGRSQSPKLQIDTSPKTGNFIIACSHCGYWLDSASKIKDAELVLNTALEILKEYPINKFTPENWSKWMKIHHEKIPMVDAVMLSVTEKDKDEILEIYQKHGGIPLDYPGYKTNMFSEVIDINAES
ncbi:hypothetical protein [Chamaesiphon sp. VAR_69_metabat_338]|uniref:hypothetical protein n=1 Tax=Chamaesiphon sp. VAR_69_metabat_338 TaxID=2964704 RepID=UPI00286E0D09|nr:hypothetical protein [Chamaesiphon sp. VAR_69_metabat_338]